MDISVLGFNIHHGRGMDLRLDLDRIAAVIKKSSVDICGLHEVDRQFSLRSRFQDQAVVLAQRLDMNVVFGPAITRGEDSQFGNALLSRYPISDYHHHVIGSARKRTEDRSIIEATVDLGGVEVICFVTHFSLNRDLHQKQVSFLTNRICVKEKPVIIIADGNRRPQFSGWVPLTHYVYDVWSSRKNGATFPATFPLIRLDYLFVSEHFDIRTAEVVKANPIASDHLPVKAVLNLKKDG
ncbi:endonuclease/exonuclease/phosphatase family protein [Desertibacillus haloalkaliphilus]|uniref:endonuclease/exonuclease/phosphatase family protein n=1 Tax=Desertibacillus haloalkaliphilus TaxID=1328930 RepID=UPI001C25D2C6|nr:endonuclease/exonuclease/phosphatase family protein [Desertibacillus haloalkaliphilus]MBU8905812.1 endonuclease [Desertibacillus haloalkaliphilus]